MTNSLARPASLDHADGSTQTTRSSVLRSVGTVLLEAGGSLAVFYIARAAGAGDLAAYLLACVPPLVGAAVGIVRTRRFDSASIAIVAFNLMSAAFVAVGSHSPSALLYKDCVVTALIGLTFLASIVIGKPLTHLFGLRFMEAERDRYEMLWATEPAYRSVQRRISAVWAAAFLIEAAVKVVVIANMSFGAAYGITQILPFAAIAAAIWYTVRAGHKARQADERSLSPSTS